MTYISEVTHIINPPPKLALVIPCYNEQEVLPETVARLSALLAELATSGRIQISSFILLVDDGSRDDSYAVMQALKANGNPISILKLSRNFGHQAALLAGLHKAADKADVIISVDADLQDDLAAISEMLTRWQEGFEIVYGVRKQRTTDTFFKRKTAEAFYHFMKTLGVEITFNHADYRLASARVLKELLQFGEVNLFLRGIFHLLGFQSAVVYYDRKERFAGESKYPLKKMLSFAFEGITSFSIKPLRMVTITGFVISLFSLAAGAYALYSYLMLDAVQGWTSIVLPMYFIGGLQLFCIGILGEYLGKVYKEVKHRPRYIIDHFSE